MDEETIDKIKNCLEDADFMLECLLTSAKNNLKSTKASCEDIVRLKIREKLGDVQELIKLKALS